jgi:hypothetical protein
MLARGLDMGKFEKKTSQSAKETRPISETRIEVEHAVSPETVERAFWEANDSANHIDWRKAERMRLPNLKRS